jgi:hypothetical protein
MRQIVEKTRWLTTDQIDGKAEMLLYEYGRSFGPVVSPPVPARKIIEAYLDLAIDWCTIPETGGERILACLSPRDREVRFNETHREFFEQYFGTETFTLAHEAGHWVLHVQEADAVQMPLFEGTPPREFLCRAQGPDSADSFEWQAHRFAAALVMPEIMVREHAEKVDLYQWPSLYCMREVFDVSITALRKRLEALGLLYVAPDKGLWPSYEDYIGQPKLR